MTDKCNQCGEDYDEVYSYKDVTTIDMSNVDKACMSPAHSERNVIFLHTGEKEE